MPYQPRDMKTWARKLVTVAGSFAPNGASALVAANFRGVGFTVARSSAGLFLVTLDRVYCEVHSATATVQLAAAADMHAQIGTITLAAAGPPQRTTFEIRTIVVATPTDIAANAQNRVNFVFVGQLTGQG